MGEEAERRGPELQRDAESGKVTVRVTGVDGPVTALGMSVLCEESV